MVVHSLRSKSMLTQICEEKKMTGKKASPLGILMELNKKKDKKTREEIGEVYDYNLVMTFEQYKPRFDELYGEDKDPL
ncbi:hypothetical protein LIER_42444 [Lithospermum erythrorhizon]|uniref:Uncharacterized protein n=1 Tax=Lithospermum erythrorhizon TaxID=34254 RepID=A0AAV3RPR2_LITER